MAVAVDHEHRTRGCRPTCQRPVEIQMVRRSIHFDHRLRFDGHSEELVVIQIIARAVRRDAVGRVRDDRHERMLHGAGVPLHQAVRRVAGPVVQRGEDDVEPREHPVRKIQTSVRQDVDFAAVEDLDARKPRPRFVDFVGLALDAVQGQIPRRRGTRRVVGDRAVLVAEIDARPDHRVDRIAAVAPRRVHVEVSADVAPRHQPRQRARQRARDLVVAFANLGRNRRQAERAVDVFLGLGPQEPVLRAQTVFRQRRAERCRMLPQGVDVRKRAGEEQQFGARVSRRREPDAHLRVLHQHVRAPRASMEAARDDREMKDFLDCRRRVAAPGQDLDVADALAAAAQRSDRPRPVDARQRLQPIHERFGDRHGTAEGNARQRPAQRRQREADLLLDVGGDARHVPDRAFLDGRREIRNRRGAARAMNGGEFFERHGPRLEQPAQIRGQIDDRGLDEHPAARLVHLPQPDDGVGVVAGGFAFEQRTEIRVGGDAARPGQAGGAGEERHFGGVAADLRERGERVERSLQRGVPGRVRVV